jgi:transposase
LNHWNGLTRVLDDGRIELAHRRTKHLSHRDQSQEGALRGPRSVRGEVACIASLIETCKLHGVDPQTYVTDVLTKVVNLWPASGLD